MKQLNLFIILMMTATLSCEAQTGTSTNKEFNLDPITGLVMDETTTNTLASLSPYMSVSGRVFNSENKKVGISLYILEDNCTWDEIESYKDKEYEFLLERDQEYQVWFHDNDYTKVIYIDKGYFGGYNYDINVNFKSLNCMRLSPGDNGLMEAYIMSFDALKPLIYQKEILD